MRKVKEITTITVGMNVYAFARHTQLSSSLCFTFNEMLGIWQPWGFQQTRLSIAFAYPRGFV